MSVQVLSPGLLTTLQDGGRRGWRHLGIGSAGALDPYASAIANLLVGNDADAPMLEFTLVGPTLRFERAARIALCGAEFEAHSDDGPLPRWQRIDLAAGSSLTIAGCRRGARGYLAIAGGFAVPRILGSASTDLRGGFGGMRGRPLQRGDVLPVAAAAAASPPRKTPAIARWWIDPTPELDFAQPAVIRLLPGRDALVPADALFARPWQVAPASDRQGLRLQAANTAADQPLRAADAGERVSEPVAPGTVQLPPDGRPIVLLADAQTHGGYPRIGHVIAADRPRLAQLRPGDTLRFLPCSAELAREALAEQRQRLARIALAIAAKPR